MNQSGGSPLTGYRVAVTSSWRADQLCTMLRRYDATVCAAAAITVVDLHGDELRARTKALIAHPPDILVATTAAGLSGWIRAAGSWGLADALITALSKAVTVSNGSKVTGALRAAGLPERWASESGFSREILCRLLESGVTGCRVAVQLPGATEEWDSVSETVDKLCAAGADVVPVRVYRWQPAAPGGEFDRLVAQIAHRELEAVCFTSAAAVVATLVRAAELGIATELHAALRGGVHAMCVGPLAAAPLVRLGIPASLPRRPRLGSLARHIAVTLPLLSVAAMQAAGHRIEIRGSQLSVDGEIRTLSPAEMALLRALAQHPGTVVARERLLEALPGNQRSDHAVDTAVLRLRKALGDKNIVVTVVKRGYRLAIDEGAGGPVTQQSGRSGRSPQR